MNNKEVDNQRIRANGKLLLSGEYVILDGAWGIGLPVKLGQSLEISNSSENGTKGPTWRSLDVENNIWFEGEVDSTFSVTSNHDPIVASTLESMLKACKRLNPQLSLAGIESFETKLEFDRNWGLGSSSTLIYLLASWAKVNPFELLDVTLGGSGYDIACAGTDEQLLITRKQDKVVFEKTVFNPTFKDCLHFVFLEQKQDTGQALDSYSQLQFDRQNAARGNFRNFFKYVENQRLKRISNFDRQA